MKRVLKQIDYSTIIMLFSLFIVVSALTEAGVVDFFVSLFSGFDNPFVLYTLVLFGSVFLSAFIDNIPYVTAMLPVVGGIAQGLNIEPYLLYFALLCGSSLGGNLTPFGASANVSAVGILRSAGYEIKTRDFLKIGVPTTLSAVLICYVTLYLLW